MSKIKQKIKQQDIEYIVSLVNDTLKKSIVREQGKKIHLIIQEEQDIKEIKEKVGAFFKNTIIARTEGLLLFTFNQDDNSEVLIDSIYMFLDKKNFPDFQHIVDVCLPLERRLSNFEYYYPDRLRELVVVDNYHQQKSIHKYPAFVFANEKLFEEKLPLFKDIQGNVELLFYVVTHNDYSGHPQVIKFQKIEDQCYFVLFDSQKGDRFSVAWYTVKNIKEAGYDPQKIMVNEKGRQSTATGCWVFALNDGKRMGREPDLFRKLHDGKYNCKDLGLGYLTCTIPPQYYTMIQSFNTNTLELYGMKPYIKDNKKFSKQHIHHRLLPEERMYSDTLESNVERYTVIQNDKDINLKNTQRLGKYQKSVLSGFKDKNVFRNNDELVLLIRQYNGALLNIEYLNTIAQEQQKVKSQGVPLPFPSQLRLDDWVGQENLEQILDRVKNELGIKRKHVQEILRKESGGFEPTYGQLLDALVECTSKKYDGIDDTQRGVITVLKEVLAEIKKERKESWQDRRQKPSGEHIFSRD